MGPVRSIAAIAATAALVGAGVAESASVKPKPGKYKGSVDVDTISFKVSASRKHITDLVTTFNPAASCSIPTNVQHERFPTLAIHHGSFHGTTSHYSIKGKFTSSTTATGTISGHIKIKSLPPCNVTKTFSVKHA